MGDWADQALRNWRGLHTRHRPTKRPATVVVCRFCGMGDLRWGMKKGGFWQVRDKAGLPHECPEIIQDRLNRPNDL